MMAVWFIVATLTNRRWYWPKSMKAACRPSVKKRIAEDQEVKLILFCTRPSVGKHFWFHCFWALAAFTFLLTYGAFAVINWGDLILVEAERDLFKLGMEPVAH
jgi:hypothetical protein